MAYRIWRALGVALVCVHIGCAPVVPVRSKPGGAARWAHAVAARTAILWSRDAQACRVSGQGVGNEGWLPDRGGSWTVSFWSAAKESVFEVQVDSDANVTTQEVADSPYRGRSLPADWQDSSRVWAATRAQQQGDPVSTFEAELSELAAPERYPNQPVWRIRFFLRAGGFETHVVSADARWLARF